MRVLVVNAGSSSVKLRVIGPGDEVDATRDLDGWSGQSDERDFASFLESAPEVEAAGHRVVHGGNEFRGPVRVNADVERALLALSPLAPLHQPRAIEGMRALRNLRPDLPQVACFDTAFHATMPAAATTYALPKAWRDQWGIRRFGFHGLSHAYASRRAAELVGRVADDTLRVVSCHLGAGASLCATLAAVRSTPRWAGLRSKVS